MRKVTVEITEVLGKPRKIKTQKGSIGYISTLQTDNGLITVWTNSDPDWTEGERYTLSNDPSKGNLFFMTEITAEASVVSEETFKKRTKVAGE